MNVTVTSASGLSNQVYIFNVKRGKSYEAKLSGIVVGGSPAIPEVNNTFTYSVPWSVQTVGTVVANLESATSSYAVDKLSSSTLNVGVNAVRITVTAQGGATKEYTLNITGQPNTVNTLSGIYVKGVMIEGFSPSVTDYTITCPFTKTGISGFTVTKSHSTVTYEIDKIFPLNLAQGPNNKLRLDVSYGAGNDYKSASVWKNFLKCQFFITCNRAITVWQLKIFI